MVRSSPLYFMNGPDFKAKQWKNATKKTIHLELFRGSRIVFGLQVIRRTLLLNREDAVIVQRYLNDYPSFIKSILLSLTDTIYVAYLKLRKIRLYWICHNIDQESKHYYPSLTAYRRWLMLNQASKIFVLDPFLEKYARLFFKDYKGQISSVTFGPYEKNLAIHNEQSPKTEVLHQGVKSYREVSQEVLLDELAQLKPDQGFVGFCAGSVLEKKVYIKNIPKLIETAEQQQVSLKMLVISDIKPESDPYLFKYLSESEHILFVNSTMHLDLFEIRKYIDFYWTGYCDLSVPYSIYSAVSTLAPTLSMNVGILPLIIKHYRIGATLLDDYSNLKSCLERFNDQKFDYASFLDSHNWSSLSNALEA